MMEPLAISVQKGKELLAKSRFFWLGKKRNYCNLKDEIDCKRRKRDNCLELHAHQCRYHVKQHSDPCND
jgi:hypothetical protein